MKPFSQHRRFVHREARNHSESRAVRDQQRWMVSYADFMTLMFAFFVVLYALSSIDLKKWVDASVGLRSAFGESEHAQDLAVPLLARSGRVEIDAEKASHLGPEGTGDAAWELMVLRDQLKEVMEIRDLGGDEKDDPVRLATSARGITLTLSANHFFAPGTADLSPGVLELLSDLAAAIATSDDEIRVEGHTDGVPLSNQRFASNWELSSARAGAVARYMIDEQRVSPGRIGIAGFGSTRAGDSEGSDEARAHERRVDIVILSPESTRRESASGRKGDPLRNILDQLEPLEETPRAAR